MADIVADPSHLLPAPRDLRTGEGVYRLTPSTPLLHSPGAEDAAALLASRLRDGLGWEGAARALEAREAAVFGEGSASAAAGEGADRARGRDGDDAGMRLLLDPQAAMGEEDYLLSVRADGVILSAAAPRGLLHAVSTLLQLLPPRVAAPDGAQWGRPDGEGDPLASLPLVRIEDGPRYAYRGLMLDVARSFLSVEEICAIVEAACAIKLNVLHLHLVDDQGWRIEITNEGRQDDDDIDYTALTRVSGATAVDAPGFTGRPGIAGWYSQEDYRTIVSFCRARGVEVIPEIDLPGHVGAALHAIPQLCTPGSSWPATEQHPTAPRRGCLGVGQTYLDPGAPATYRFLRHVLGQVARLDPQGRHLHLGGDEPWEMGERYGIGPDSAYARILCEACDIVRELGRRPVGWNECWSAAPGHITLQVWDVRGDQARRGVAQAVEQGAGLIMSPGQHAYLDQKWDPHAPLGLTWARTIDVPTARDWDPAEQAGEGGCSVLGVEAPLWSETVRGRREAELLLFPRLAAIAEVGWCRALPAGDDEARRAAIDAFLSRVAHLGPRLACAGTTFHLSPEVPWQLAVPDYTELANVVSGNTDSVPDLAW